MATNVLIDSNFFVVAQLKQNAQKRFKTHRFMKSILFVISLSYISWISDKDMNKGWLWAVRSCLCAWRQLCEQWLGLLYLVKAINAHDVNLKSQTFLCPLRSVISPQLPWPSLAGTPITSNAPRRNWGGNSCLLMAPSPVFSRIGSAD